MMNRHRFVEESKSGEQHVAPRPVFPENSEVPKRTRRSQANTIRTLLGVRMVTTLEYRVGVRGQCLWKVFLF